MIRTRGLRRRGSGGPHRVAISLKAIEKLLGWTPSAPGMEQSVGENAFQAEVVNAPEW